MGAEISKEISALLVRRAGLSESIKGLKSNIADIDNELAGLVSEDFQRQRLKEGKDFGQITLKIGNFKVTQTVPKPLHGTKQRSTNSPTRSDRGWISPRNGWT